MKILFLGDLMGRAGRNAAMDYIREMRAEIDCIIVNGENSAGGRGMTPQIADELFAAGVDVITTGDHVWDQRSLEPILDQQPRILRPINYGPDAPGQGSVVIEIGGTEVAVINALGRTFMKPQVENPFTVVGDEVDELRAGGVKVIFLDFHAEATSEKVAIGHHLDGRISCVCGTHTHVQTADESILPMGTARLSDAGMCGPEHSIIGADVEASLHGFRTALPTRFGVAKGPVRVCGAIVEVETATGRANSISRVSILRD